MIASDLVLELVVPVRGDEERHAAARHAAEHQEAPEVVAQRPRGPRAMIDSVNALVTQGMIRLSGPSQFRVVQWPSARTSAGVDGGDDLVEDLAGPPAAPATPRGRAAGTWR